MRADADRTPYLPLRQQEHCGRPRHAGREASNISKATGGGRSSSECGAREDYLANVDLEIFAGRQPCRSGDGCAERLSRVASCSRTAYSSWNGGPNSRCGPLPRLASGWMPTKRAGSSRASIETPPQCRDMMWGAVAQHQPLGRGSMGTGQSETRPRCAARNERASSRD